MFCNLHVIQGISLLLNEISGSTRVSANASIMLFRSSAKNHCLPAFLLLSGVASFLLECSLTGFSSAVPFLWVPLICICLG